MVAGDTRVHLAVLALAVGVLTTVQVVAGRLDADVPTLPLLVFFYALAFGGAHLYLALRDEGGLVPRDARWRYVAALGGLIALGVAVAVLDETRTLVGVEFRTLARGLIAVLVIVYLVVEARDGYRSALES